MNMSKLHATTISLGVILATLLACTSDGQLAGISGTGQQLGSVNGFGSVIVNGVRYDTTNAEIRIDGQLADESDLSVGMVVLVDGEIDGEFDGTASGIAFDRTLCGQVDSIDADNGNFVAAGISVETDEATVFVNTSMETLSVGTTVTVSGYLGFGGLVSAGYVEANNCRTAPQVDVEGFVEDLDAPGRRFAIGTLVVEYSRAVVNEDQGILANGAVVEVVGTRASSGSELVASQITVMSGETGDPGSDLNVEGIVNSFVSSSDFRIGTQPVSIQGAQEKDLTDEEPADGARMHVQGSINDDGVLVAHRYYVIPESVYRIAGPLNIGNHAQFQYGLMGESRFYLPITTFTDSSAAQKTNYGPDDLASGDWVVITGYRGNSSDRLVAATLERVDPGQAAARGPIDSFDVDAQVIVIGATEIRTDCGNTTQCLDRNGTPTTAELFYAELNVNDVLDAVGSEQSRDVIATTIQHR